MWQGQARPSRVNHSRPWGVQGGGYVGFSPPFLRPAQRSVAVLATLCCDQPPGIRIILRQVPRVIAGVEGFNRSTAKVTSFKGTGISGKGRLQRRPNIAFVQIPSAWASL